MTANTTPATRYIVMTASAKCAAKFGRYGKVAVVEIEDGAPTPAMISERAKGVVRVVSVEAPLSMGKGKTPGPRTAFARALTEAEAEVERLNAAR